ncbi:E3 ubiquitin-protein ligase RSL1-like [Lotus japonicus]|uniref:E3 ubiquitin-protein ligase RSL1-like n=1 Tax=Lotus japonicus TaxID=34305 RepID=UPI002585F977|nr:E3 ubiquitin-protein ligase RSL1-like [Lotus japonicus]
MEYEAPTFSLFTEPPPPSSSSSITNPQFPNLQNPNPNPMTLNPQTRTTRRRRTVLPPSIEIIDVDSISFTRRTPPTTTVIDLSDTEDDDDDDVRILNFIPANTPFGKRIKKRHTEKAESSNDAPFTCEICTDTKTVRDSFAISGCSHAYCSDCVATYVRSKLEENVINIRCPVSGCSGLLEAEDCRAILSPEVFDRWGTATCEALFAVSEKFYCPFKDCSTLLIDDGAEKVMESECPNCRRMFCAQCKVPWHDGVTCEEFQKLGKDEREKEDMMLMKLAKDQKWKRCPHCKFYVAKSEGCMYMKCRCGHAFCYNCGAPNKNPSHHCNKCHR